MYHKLVSFSCRTRSILSIVSLTVSYSGSFCARAHELIDNMSKKPAAYFILPSCRCHYFTQTKLQDLVHELPSRISAIFLQGITLIVCRLIVVRFSRWRS